MLSKPKYMTPSTNLQECVVDANSETMPFSCIVDGNEAISGWQIQIYNLKNNTLVFDTKQQTLEPAFIPVDEKNRNVVFSRDLKQYWGDWDYGSFINSPTPYYWNITFTGTSGTIVKSCEEVFYANSIVAPAITYSADGETYQNLEKDTVINTKTCWFKASYEQAEGVALKRYGWRIIDTDNQRILLDTITHNQVYGVKDNIACSCTGFLDGGNYSVEVYIETQNNSVTISEPINISTSYETTFLSNDFKTEVLRNESGIMLSWGESVVIGGRAEGFSGKVPYIENYPIAIPDTSKPSTSVKIEDDASIIFDQGASSQLDISEDSYIVLSMQLLDSKNRTIFSADGYSDSGDKVARNLLFADGKFVYYITNSDGTIIERTYTPKQPPYKYTWFVIIMSPYLGQNGQDTFLTISESRTINALYPSSSIYPSGNRYPAFGEWAISEEVE